MSLTLEKRATRGGSDRVRRLAHAARREMRSLRRGHPLRARILLAAASTLPDFALASVRSWLYRKAGFSLGEDVALLGRIGLVGQGDLTGRLWIGDGAVVAPGVVFALDAAVTLGRGVSIGPDTRIYTATHAIGFGSQRMSPAVTPRPVTVEDGAWVGMHCLVLPGVTIGRGAVVAAGAVVMEDVPPNALVAGNPATIRQTLPFGER